MSFAATVGLVGAGVAAYSTYQTSRNQKKAADRIRSSAVDPGIQPNVALDRVSQTLFENYSNWNLPGFSRYADQITANQAAANRDATRAATSSADILNSITNNQMVADSAMGDLNIAQATGKEQALMRYLDTVQQQGQDDIRMNQMQLARHDAQLREAAALEGASIQNQNNALQDVTSAFSAIAGNFTPRSTVDQTTGNVVSMPSVWSQVYGKKKNYSPTNAQLVYRGLQA